MPGRLQDDETLSRLIGGIYDAALDPSLWTGVLEELVAFTKGQAAGLLWKDPIGNSAVIHFHTGVDPYYMDLYLTKCWKFDPVSALALFTVGEVVTTSDYMPYAEFQETRFYREWARPQGLADAANVILDKSAVRITYLSILRHEAQGLVDEAMRRRIALILPHVRRAAAIAGLIDMRTAEAATFADALDGLAAAIFLVADDGHIVHANAAGEAMLADGVLRDANRRLRAPDPHADSVLHDTFLAAGSGDAAIGVKGIAVPLTASCGERHVAHVLPLTSGARRRAGTAYAAAAALFVHKTAMETLSPPEAIARHYRLTPTELRVLVAIVEVGGVPEVAKALGICETTVKTHLGHLYGKTGTGRQADLVKLVAGYASPLLA